MFGHKDAWAIYVLHNKARYQTIRSSLMTDLFPHFAVTYQAWLT